MSRTRVTRDSHLPPGDGWQGKANCNPENDPDVDPRIFDVPTTVGRLAIARSDYCDRCPVRFECYAFGVANKETGIWGGVPLDVGVRVKSIPVTYQGER